MIDSELWLSKDNVFDLFEWFILHDIEFIKPVSCRQTIIGTFSRWNKWREKEVDDRQSNKVEGERLCDPAEEAGLNSPFSLNTRGVINAQLY